MKLTASPLHTVSLRCASQSPSPEVHTAQIEQRFPLRRVVKGISCCALAIATALLVGCGDSLIGRGNLTGGNIVPGGNIVIGGGSLSGGDVVTGGVIVSAPPPAPSPAPAPSPPPPDPSVVPTAQCGGGLAAQDLAGQCRALPTTPGALEASDGISAAVVSVKSLAIQQTVSRSLQVSWQPFGNNTAGYLVYFGKTADAANVLVSDLSTDSGLFDPSAPTVTYDSVRDLGLYVGDTVCFRIYAYDPAHTIVGQVFLGCSAI